MRKNLAASSSPRVCIATSPLDTRPSGSSLALGMFVVFGGIFFDLVRDARFLPDGFSTSASVEIAGLEI